jgi:flagellar biosynthetic protein FliS
MSVQNSYREAAVRGASPVGLVVRLYEQIIEDLRQATIDIEQSAIERRTKRIDHAILVIGHLQSPLDFVNGGKVAKDLDHFYNVLRQNLIQVQFHPSKPALAQHITDLLAVREAWIVVERAERPALTSAAVTATAVTAAPVTTAVRAVPYSAAEPASGRARMDFRG